MAQALSIFSGVTPDGRSLAHRTRIRIGAALSGVRFVEHRTG